VLQFAVYQFEDGDFLLNVCLFVPIGALMHHEGRSRSRALSVIVVWVALSAGLLSLSIELSQALLPSRDSSLFDVLANTGGALGGVALDATWGTSIASRFEGWRIGTSPAMLAAMMTSFTVLALGISALLQARTRLSNWTDDYPLLIGNEATGDRAWRGRIFRLTITDAATPFESVRRFSDGASVVLQGAQLADYDFSGSAPYEDGSGNLPDFQWTHHSSKSTSPGVELSDVSWLATRSSASALSRRVREANAFTLRVMCATDDTNEYRDGPARIVSNSVNPFQRNFTIGQEREDLVVRLRTPETGDNGSHFETRAPGVFSTTAVRDVLVTYNGATLLTAASGSHRITRTDLTAGAWLADVFTKVTDTYPPIPTNRLPLFDAAYRAGLFLVPGMLLGLLSRTSSQQFAFGLVYVITFTLLFEVMLILASGRPFDAGNVAQTVVGGVIIVTLVVGTLSPGRVRELA
jgi:glycopeptide antibiotics resistance protein